MDVINQTHGGHRDLNNSTTFNSMFLLQPLTRNLKKYRLLSEGVLEFPQLSGALKIGPDCLSIGLPPSPINIPNHLLTLKVLC